MFIFTTLLLGCSRSGASFVLPFGVILRLSNITPGGSVARVVRRNTKRKRDNTKNFKSHIIGSIITSKDFYQ